MGNFPGESEFRKMRRMTCRLVLTSVLIASSWLLPNGASAQGLPGSYRMGSPYGPPPNAGGFPSMYSGSPYPEGDLTPLVGPDTTLPQGMSGYGPPPGYGPPGGGRYGSAPPRNGRLLGMGRVGQRLFGPPGEQERGPTFPDTPAVPYQTANPSTAVPGVGYYGRDGIVTRRIPDEESWDEDGPVERLISTVLKNSYFRTEYLFWDIQSPEGLRLGATLAGGNVDPDNIALLDGNNQVVALGRIPTTDKLQTNDNNGVRLTLGVPLMGGDFELSGFMLEQASDRDRAPDLPSNPLALIPRVVVTSTTTNGAAGSNVFVYDRSYDVDYKSDVWGLDSKYVFDVLSPDMGLRLRPFLGVRYMNIDEIMTQRGVFDNFGQNVPLTTLIESSSYNNLFGGQIGTRLEFVHPWFTLGAEPRAGLGVNKSKARVQTTNLRSLADGEFTTTQQDTRFTPVFEARLYGQVHLTDYFTLHAGYNWMYIPNLIRANNIINYNDNGLNNPPGVVVDSRTSELTIKGLSVGGEFRFR